VGFWWRAVRRRISRILIAVLAASVAGRAGAQEPDPHAVQPERPTVATHAGTVSPGYLEIETGVERDRFDAFTTGYSVPTLFKFGVASHAQLGIGVPLSRPAPGLSGLADVTAGLKWRLVDDAPVLGDFALLPAIKLPTGSTTKGTGTGTTDVSLLAISSHKFGEVSMDINAGYTRRGGNGTLTPTSATLWTASFGGPFAGIVGWTVECYGYPGTGGPAGQAPIVAFLGGPTFLARSWLAFDAGVIVPAAGPQPRALYAGGVYNVGRLWTQHP
jgi:hypothetical protein